MPKYYGDQNKVVFLHESGTYGIVNASGGGVWLGFITGQTIEDSTGVISTRYIGTASRNVGRFDDGPLDHTGTVTYIPQDMRLLAFALGSCVDAGSPSPYTHVISEVNNGAGNAFTSGTIQPFLSFQLEDSKSAGGGGFNFIRTYKGCVVDTWSLKGTQGGLLEASADWLAQSVAYSSGTATVVAEDTAHKTYKWSDVLFHLPSGTIYPELKAFDFSVSNKLDKNHYLNGSRVIATPSATDRDYKLSLTLDMESTRSKALYDQYFMGGSTFNCAIWAGPMGTTGSQDFYLVMSGCKAIKEGIPTRISDEQEITVDVVPQSVNCAVNDLTQKYMSW
jgi:hypothetical protein